MSAKWKTLLIGLLGLLMYLTGWYVLIMRSKRTFQNHQNPFSKKTPKAQSVIDDVIYNRLKDEYEADEIDRIIAMAKHETGNYTSDILKENNNLFGMKMPRVRKTTAIGENRGHAKYENIEASIDDLVLWFDFHKGLPEFQDTESFIEWLKSKGYFEDSYENYLNGVKRWM